MKTRKKGTEDLRICTLPDVLSIDDICCIYFVSLVISFLQALTSMIVVVLDVGPYRRKLISAGANCSHIGVVKTISPPDILRRSLYCGGRGP